MKTITNHTGYVITVGNRHFTKEMAIADTVTVADEDFDCDDTLSVRYFSLKNTKTENKAEIVRDLDRSLVLWFSSSSKIPLQTEINIKDSSTVVLTTQTVSFHLCMTLWIKKLRLQRIVAEKDKLPHTFSFVDPTDRKRFFIKMCLELVILCPVALLLLLMLPFSYVSFAESWGVLEYTLLHAIALLSTYSCVRKLVFCILAKKDKVGKRSE